jgi:hypothetical protein
MEKISFLADPEEKPSLRADIKCCKMIIRPYHFITDVPVYPEEIYF